MGIRRKNPKKHKVFGVLNFLKELFVERKGFEPSICCHIHAFQACAFSHSATSLNIFQAAKNTKKFDFRKLKITFYTISPRNEVLNCFLKLSREFFWSSKYINFVNSALMVMSLPVITPISFITVLISCLPIVTLPMEYWVKLIISKPLVIGFFSNDKNQSVIGSFPARFVSNTILFS